MKAKKRLVLLLLILVVQTFALRICAAAGSQTTVRTVVPLKEPYTLGDSDGNGIVESVDVTWLQRYLSDMEIPYSKIELMRGDVDRSGELELPDATAIQYYLAKLKTPYAIGRIIE